MAAYGSYRGNVQDQFGRPIDAVTVTVYLQGTATLATLYSDRSLTSLANPFTNEADGSWIFYADVVNRYDIVFSKTGVTFDNTDFQDVVVDQSTGVAYLGDNNTFSGNQLFTGTAEFDGTVQFDNTVTHNAGVTFNNPVTGIAHSETEGQTVNDHHNQSHAHNGADSSGTVAHDNTTGITANNHHNQLHVIDDSAHHSNIAPINTSSSSIANGAEGTVTISTGLSQDAIAWFIAVEAIDASGTAKANCGAIGVNASGYYKATSGDGASVPATIPSAPSTGNLRFQVYNNSGVSSQIRIYGMIMHT